MAAMKFVSKNMNYRPSWTFPPSFDLRGNFELNIKNFSFWYRNPKLQPWEKIITLIAFHSHQVLFDLEWSKRSFRAKM